MPKKKRGDSASPLFKIGCFFCYLKKVGTNSVTYLIGNYVKDVAIDGHNDIEQDSLVHQAV